MTTDNGHAEMPQGWRNVPLRSLCLKTELADPTKSPHKSFRYIDVSAVSNGLWKIISSTEHTGSTAPSRARKLVKANDVIFATVRPTLRRVAMVPDHLDGQVVSTAFCVIRVNPTQADALFIYYSLLTDEFLDRIGNVQRGASYPAVTDGDVLRQEILVPPLSEQCAIAAVLSKIQSAVEVQEKVVATLKELKAATMAKLFREGLRGEPLKQTEIGEIPQTWDVVRLGTVAELLSGGTPSKSRPEWWRGPIPWASPKDMKQPRLWDTQDHISQEALEDGSRLVPARTLFVVIRGMILAKDLPVAMTEVPMAFNQDMKAVIPADSIDPEYLLYAIVSCKDALTREIGTSAHGTRRMGTSSLEALPIPRPEKDEQREIARAIRAVEQREETALKRRDRIKSLFSSMLHLLMTGEVRVNHLKLSEEQDG
ncbi:MAG: restriction endonuclease subunit S [Candidatus Tectomicrobia bacterium]|uniref:Restriction endonuclease subunit S n=1 Tax=Tectimicrobiota bacterium TaxID=2528274 RepID=A0A932GQ07_UNCTE|nr:restriction endonuclease subunit S [Candidatus Tectomicrobia bacterium]